MSTSSKFGHLVPKKADPIISLFQDFLADKNPAKVNLSIGLYFDEEGRIDMMNSIRQAYVANAEANKPTGYLPIEGDREFLAAVQKLCFGFLNERSAQEYNNFVARTTACQSVAASGGLNLVANVLKKLAGLNRVWMTDPTWSNHHDFFRAAGFTTGSFQHLDHSTNTINFPQTLADLEAKLEKGDVVLLHPVCHNPSGADFTREQWQQVCNLIKERGAYAVFDMAYLGYGQGLRQDVVALEVAYDTLPEFAHIFSCSKTFGLYADRTGAVNFVTESPEVAQKLLTQVRQVVRAQYSTPILNGSQLVKRVLTEPTLFAQWQDELAHARNRLRQNRLDLSRYLLEQGVDMSYIETQNGFFSHLKVTPEQARKLRTEHAIYILETGRINFAGVNPQNVKRIADAIACVVKE